MKKLRLTILDDDPAMLLFIARMLRDQFDVITIQVGKRQEGGTPLDDILEAIVTGDYSYPDIILTDMLMGSGMLGTQVADRFAGMPHVRVVLMTGGMDEALEVLVQERLADGRFADKVDKPMGRPTLVSALDPKNGDDPAE